MQNLKENMAAGIKLPSKGSSAVREAADETNVAQGDCCAEDYIKALLADTP